MCFSPFVGHIRDVETIASGKGIRERRRLLKLYGGRSWKKPKGTATVKLADRTLCDAEVPCCEAHGIGAREFKRKRISGNSMKRTEPQFVWLR